MGRGYNRMSSGFGCGCDVNVRHCLVAVCLLGALLPGGASWRGAVAQGAVFVPSDKSPAKNPCPDKGKVPDTDFAAFKEMLKNALAKETGVIEDIDAQVKGRVPDADERAVEVEFYVVDEAEFKKEYSGDVDSLDPGKKQADLENEASNLYGSKSAYTYITEPDGNGHQKVKVKVFCKDSLRMGMIDGSMLELIVHELVHAKLYVMRILMPEKDPDDKGTFPFPDHDEKGGNDGDDWDEGGDKGFYDEVKRLLEKAKKNPKLAYVQGHTFSGELAGVVELYDVYSALIGTVPAMGYGTFVLGTPGDSDGDGRQEIPVEIVAMSLTGSIPYPVSIREDPARTSSGRIEQKAPGAAFPADSFFDVFFEYQVSLAAGTGSSRLSADIHTWPPFGAQFTGSGEPPSPVPPPQSPGNGGSNGGNQGHLVAAALSPNGVVIGSLALWPLDTDGDGMTDEADPDDDNDGTPDVEDPRPRPLPFRAVTAAVARDR